MEVVGRASLLAKYLHRRNLDKIFTRTRVWMKRKEPYIKSGETSYRLEEGVEFLLLPSNGYPY